MTIGDVVRRSGVAASALRYYEERGLIVSAARSRSAHRHYSRSVLRRIAFIVFAQKIGLSLDEIRAELAKLPADHIPGAREWSRLSGTWVARVDERIAELQRLRQGLAKCIGCGCLSLSRCQLANPDDRLAARGSGPRYWLGDAPGPAVRSARSAK